MAIIVNSDSAEDFVSNVRGSVNDLNKARVTWDWPRNNKYNLCIVFDIQEDESLETLLASCQNRTTYEDEFNLSHTALLTNKYIQFKIYPARKTESGELEIVNQTKDNLSQRFLKKSRISYTVDYRKQKFGFGSGLIATVKIVPFQDICADYLCYQIVGGNKQDAKYGVDLGRFCRNGEFSIFVNKGEQVRLFLDEKQKEYMELI
jgi:hypothetical protein